MITIDSGTLTKLAKAIPSNMKHTQKLDAFAKILGYPDQTALMFDLKRKEALAAPAPAAPVAPLHLTETAAPWAPPQYTLDHKIREIFEAHIGSFAESDVIYDREEWRRDVSRGDTRSGYEEWLEQQIGNLLDHVGVYHVLAAYLRWDVMNGTVVLNAGKGGNASLESAADNVHSFWNIAGGTDAIGEDVMHILEDIIEDVRNGNESSEELRRDVIEGLMDSVHQRWGELQNSRENPSPE